MTIFVKKTNGRTVRVNGVKFGEIGRYVYKFMGQIVTGAIVQGEFMKLILYLNIKRPVWFSLFEPKNNGLTYNPNVIDALDAPNLMPPPLCSERLPSLKKI